MTFSYTNRSGHPAHFESPSAEAQELGQQRSLKKQRSRYQSVVKSKAATQPFGKLPSVMIINEAMQIQQNQSPLLIQSKKSPFQGGLGAKMNTTEISRQKLETVESGDLAGRGQQGFADGH